jgi:hypothetical protein
MIRDPDYITWLRRQYRCQDVLNLLHLSSVGIGWHLLGDLAITFGGHNKTINQSMLRLRRHGLAEYVSYGAGGSFVWWLKQHPQDRPDRASGFPRWVLRDLSRKRRVDVLVGDQTAWAQRLQVHPGTMRNFLSGRTHTLLGRYELAYDPAEWLARKCCDLQQVRGDGLG